MTNTLPRRRTILQLSQIRLTLARTFIVRRSRFPHSIRDDDNTAIAPPCIHQRGGLRLINPGPNWVILARRSTEIQERDPKKIKAARKSGSMIRALARSSAADDHPKSRSSVVDSSPLGPTRADLGAKIEYHPPGRSVRRPQFPPIFSIAPTDRSRPAHSRPRSGAPATHDQKPTHDQKRAIPTDRQSILL